MGVNTENALKVACDKNKIEIAELLLKTGLISDETINNLLDTNIRFYKQNNYNEIISLLKKYRKFSLKNIFNH